MGTDPDPNKVLTVLYGKGAVVDPGPHGPQVSHLLEVQRGMRGVFFQEFEVLSGDHLDGIGEVGKQGPKTHCGTMPLEILESSLGLPFMGLTREEIESSRPGVSFDFLVPLFPALFR